MDDEADFNDQHSSWSCLNYDEIKMTLSILSDCDMTFVDLIANFRRTFHKNSDQFRICCAMGSLVRDNLLTEIQRIMVIVMLFGISVPLYQPIICDIYDGARERVEKLCIQKLVLNPDYFNEIANNSPQAILTSLKSSQEVIDDDKIFAIRAKKNESYSKILHKYDCLGIDSTITVPSSFIQDGHLIEGFAQMIGEKEYLTSPPKSLNWTEEEIQSELLAASLFPIDEASYIKPSFMQWAPPMMEITSDEIVWMDDFDDDVAYLLWDDSMSKFESNQEQLKDLLTSAFTSPLNPKQQQQLAAKIRNDRNFLLEYHIKPEHIPSLVENNSTVAVECLIKFMSVGKTEVMQHLMALVTMDMSFHSIEVVNGLSLNATKEEDLPKEFIHCYISHCITSCEAMMDKFLQIRFVRLVCVLLQSLLRKSVVDIKGLFAEIQAFCLTFPRVKEANLLFRLIKSIEGS
mmetsp:Transcript_19934/g.28556  ORF Transcript_19934/g.28556 Transcript_19934/m.28556 type:complete len:460 (+) Transcript_19934:1700-3079(+)